MEYISVKDAAKKWKIGPRRVQYYCCNNKIPGVKYMGKQWIIPIDAVKPVDSRIKNANYSFLNSEYHFPIFIYTNMYASNSDASDNEMLLFKAELYHLMGEYTKSSNICKVIANSTHQIYLSFGAYAFMYFNASLIGDSSNANKYLKQLKEYQNEDKEHSEDYKLIIEAYNSFANPNNSKLLSLDFSKMSSEALCYYQCFLYLHGFIQNKEFDKSDYLQALIFEHQLETKGIEPASMMIDFILSSVSSSYNEEEKAMIYLDKALKIAINNNWLCYFSKFYFLKREFFHDLLIKNHPEMIDFIENIAKKESENIKKEIY